MWFQNLDEDNDPTCELTSGSIVCGSVSRALRNRRQKDNDITAKQAEQLLSKVNEENIDAAGKLDRKTIFT